MQYNKTSVRRWLAAITVLAVLSSLFLMGAGKLQGDQGRIVTRFGPAVFAQEHGEKGVLIALLLPAVQGEMKAPFRVLLVSRDAILSIPVPGIKSRKSALFDVYLANTEEGMFIRARHRQTGQIYSARTTSTDFTIQIESAISPIGERVPPTSSSATMLGIKEVKLGDGSVTPQAVEYALPPVQAEAFGDV